MATSKVACPHCQSTLKSSRPLPAGMEVRCPKCHASFKVDNGAASAARSAGPVPATGILVPPRNTTVADTGAVTTLQPTPRPPGPSERAMPADVDLARRPSRNIGWIIAVGGGFFLVLVTGLLLFLCFSGEKKPEPDSASMTELPEPEFKPPPPRPLIELTKEEEERVTELVSRGVAYLKKTQNPNTGTWPGEHSDEYAGMAGLTLLECGVDAKDPVVQKAANFVRQKAKAFTGTYGLALYILFLDKLNDRSDKALIRELALRLAAGQTAAGGWTYNNKVLSPEQTDLLADLLKEIGTKTFAEFAKEQPERIKRYAPLGKIGLGALQRRESKQNDFFRAGGDNSNTQFALLALWTARRHDLPLDRTLSLVVQRFRSSQNSDGSWNYQGTHNASPLPTMTCAGLLGLAVGYGLNDAKDRPARGPQQDEAIQKALAHLSNAIGQPPKQRGGRTAPTQMYFLWSVERVAVLYQQKTIGDKEWYQWGLSMLSGRQQPDGSLQGGGGHGSSPLVDTCFALLFLQRVNLAQDLTDKLRELAQGSTPQPPVIDTKQ
jgi:hypothetical protein